MSMNGKDRRKLIDKRWRQQGGRCHYCACRMTLPPEIRAGPVPYKCATVDHVTPKALGGSDKWENLVACCRRCNEAKGSLSLDAWDKMLSARLGARFGS